MVVKLNAMFMILLWAGFLPLISSHRRPSWTKAPVCEAYNLPENTTWIARTSCDEHKRFRCAEGHIAKVQTVCKNGKWIEELACPEVQCPAGETLGYTDEKSPLGILSQSYKLNCSMGATRRGQDLVIKCGSDGNKGRWEVITACTLVLCPSTDGVINFESPVRAGSSFGTVDTKQCATGYQQNGDEGSVECTADRRNGDGKWTIVKDCVVVRCQGKQARFAPGATIPDGIFNNVYNLQCDTADINSTYSQAICKADGQWQEAPCKDCFGRYKRFDFHFEEEILNNIGSFLIPVPDVDCEGRCEARANCTDFASITHDDETCYLLFESSVIFFDQLNRTACIAECNSTSECVAMNHWKIKDICVLFNQTDGILRKTVWQDDTILRKGVCPFIL